MTCHVVELGSIDLISTTWQVKSAVWVESTMTSLTYPNVYQQNMSILDKNISNFVSLRGET